MLQQVAALNLFFQRLVNTCLTRFSALFITQWDRLCLLPMRSCRCSQPTQEVHSDFQMSVFVQNRNMLLRNILLLRELQKCSLHCELWIVKCEQWSVHNEQWTFHCSQWALHCSLIVISEMLSCWFVMHVCVPGTFTCVCFDFMNSLDMQPRVQHVPRSYAAGMHAGHGGTVWHRCTTMEWRADHSGATS
jgi:hypothetical protein